MTGVPVELLGELYGANAQEIVTVIDQYGRWKSKLIIGHNPGIGALAAQVLRAAPAHPRFADYPTGATTVVHGFKGAAKSGELVGFTVPRDLT